MTDNRLRRVQADGAPKGAGVEAILEGAAA
jgi:hypothetical protein